MKAKNVFTIVMEYLCLNVLVLKKKDGTFAEIYEKWLPGEIPSE